MSGRENTVFTFAGRIQIERSMMETAASSEKTAAEVPRTRRPRVVESYSDYIPPFKIAPIIERMLDSVSAEYLNGLSEVVLTNFSGLSRSRRRSVTTSRKRKIHVERIRGLYHPAWRE
jgi:hypothetical protein